MGRDSPETVSILTIANELVLFWYENGTLPICFGRQMVKNWHFSGIKMISTG